MPRTCADLRHSEPSAALQDTGAAAVLLKINTATILRDLLLSNATCRAEAAFKLVVRRVIRRSETSMSRRVGRPKNAIIDMLKLHLSRCREDMGLRCTLYKCSTQARDLAAQCDALFPWNFIQTFLTDAACTPLPVAVRSTSPLLNYTRAPCATVHQTRAIPNQLALIRCVRPIACAQTSWRTKGRHQQRCLRAQLLGMRYAASDSMQLTSQVYSPELLSPARTRCHWQRHRVPSKYVYTRI